MKSSFQGQALRVSCAAVFSLLLATPAFALQSLCSNSPENPTVILSLLGAAAAGYPWLRQRGRDLFKRKNRAAKQEESV